MSIVYTVKAAIVNESKTDIERYAAKITQVTEKTDEDFIRTFPLLTHPKNLSCLNSLKEDLEPYKKGNFLGISIISYGYINFIHFTSTFKSFHLNKGDTITCSFDNGEELAFKFNAPKTTVGFLHKNIHPIKDTELQLLANANLEYWKLTCAQRNMNLVGGFCFNEYNKQYKSEKVGRKMLRLMAANIIKIKDKLRDHY